MILQCECERTDERWVPLVFRQYKSNYFVSDQARIKIWRGGRWVFPRFYKVKVVKSVTPKYYLYFYPEKSEWPWPAKVHRCVLLSFCHLRVEKFKEFVTDHMNGQTATIRANWLDNLRWATPAFNMLNRDARGWQAEETKDGLKYRPCLRFASKTNLLGNVKFDTPWEAKCLYDRAKQELMSRLEKDHVINPF